MRRGVPVGAIVLALVLGACDDDGPTVSPLTTVSIPNDPTTPRPPLSNVDGSNEAFSGVGQLTGYGSTCTAFLLDAGPLDGPAYAMTNGHCVGIFDSETVIRDGVGAEGRVTFRRFADTPDAHTDVAVRGVRYATMRGTDVAVVELDATRADLAGLASYHLAAPPPPGATIRPVGIPVAGLDEPAWVLRGETCTTGATTRLVEWEWLWDAATSSDCTGILPGSSGSPVFDAADPTTVVGVVNTTTIGARVGPTCSLGAPCEITDAGVTPRGDRTYAMPVGAWAACFVPAWDADAPGCPTEQAPIGVGAPWRAVQPGATWNASTGGPTAGGVVVKTGSLATTDCRDGAGYEAVAAPSRYDEHLPPDEGLYVLCGAALDAAGRPITRDAGLAVMVVDDTPPDRPIRLSRVTDEDGVRVEPLFDLPEYASFQLKVGPGASTDCASAAGYSIYRRIPLPVAAAELPARLCVIGEDEAGNSGPPQAFDLP